MSVKASGWSGLLALMLLARAAYAQVDVEAPPNVDSLDEAATRVEVAHCNRPACRSIALIDQAVQLQIAGAAANRRAAHAPSPVTATYGWRRPIASWWSRAGA